MAEEKPVEALTLEMMQKAFAAVKASADRPYVPPPLLVSIEGRDRLLQHDIRHSQGYCLRCNLPAYVVGYMDAPGTRTCGPESEALFEKIVAAIRDAK